MTDLHVTAVVFAFAVLVFANVGQALWLRYERKRIRALQGRLETERRMRVGVNTLGTQWVEPGKRGGV